jgi:hypothetical protein
MLHKPFIKASDAKAALRRPLIAKYYRDEKNKIATTGTHEAALLNVTYCYPVCFLMKEPAFVSIGDCIIGLVGSKGALCKSLQCASQFPGNRDFVVRELDRERKVYVGNMKPGGYDFLRGFKVFLGDKGVVAISDITGEGNEDLLFKITEYLEASARQLFYAILNVGENTVGYDVLRAHIKTTPDRIAIACLVVGVLGCLRNEEDAVVNGLNIILSKIYGISLISDYPFKDILHFGRVIHFSPLNDIFGASFIWPTSEGFTLLTRAGNCDKGNMGLRERFRSIISAGDGTFIIDRAMDVANEILSVETRQHVHNTKTVPTNIYEMCAALLNQIRSFENHIIEILFNGAVDEHLENWLIGSGFLRSGNEGKSRYPSSQPVPRLNSQGIPYEGSSAPNMD